MKTTKPQSRCSRRLKNSPSRGILLGKTLYFPLRLFPEILPNAAPDFVRNWLLTISATLILSYSTRSYSSVSYSTVTDSTLGYSYSKLLYSQLLLFAAILLYPQLFWSQLLYRQLLYRQLLFRQLALLSATSFCRWAQVRNSEKIQQNFFR